ncbi:MAG: MerR family transcriptional regulator [Acidobacteria bacterium]|nr:MAG: MerR family transcriptional regulator [Acidobacteriota bacterium]
MQDIPKRLYYRIGEVCEILGVEAHVLRYWESEFSRLSPPKNKAGQRTYRPKDIELLLEIRKLLYEEGFTIAGARRKLSEGAAPAPAVPRPPAPAKHKTAATQGSKTSTHRINQVRRELESILTLLERE